MLDEATTEDVIFECSVELIDDIDLADDIINAPECVSPGMLPPILHVYCY